MITERELEKLTWLISENRIVRDYLEPRWTGDDDCSDIVERIRELIKDAAHE